MHCKIIIAFNRNLAAQTIQREALGQFVRLLSLAIEQNIGAGSPHQHIEHRLALRA